MKILTFIKGMLTSSRFKSLYWRTGGMAASAFLLEVQQYLTDWDASSLIVVVAGLVIGEITKKLNKYS